MDSNEDLTEDILEGLGPDAQLMTGPFCEDQFAGADVIVASPGIPARNIAPFIGNLPERAIISELELASWFANEPKIAITGTNGKTTTTALIKHILEDSGRTVFAGANYGTPLSEFIYEDGKLTYWFSKYPASSSRTAAYSGRWQPSCSTSRPTTSTTMRTWTSTCRPS